MRIVRDKKRTAFQQDRILAALTARPMTGQQLAALVHLAYGGVAKYVRDLKKERRVFISGYARSHGRAACIYSVGDKPDAPFARASVLKGSIEARRKKEILAALKMTMTMQILAAKIGLSERRCASYVRLLRDDNKVYISQWKRSLGNPIPYYTAGQGVDAPKPEPHSRRHYTERANKKKTAWVGALSPQNLPSSLMSAHRINMDSEGPVRIRRAA